MKLLICPNGNNLSIIVDIPDVANDVNYAVQRSRIFIPRIEVRGIMERYTFRFMLINISPIVFSSHS